MMIIWLVRQDTASTCYLFIRESSLGGRQNPPTNYSTGGMTSEPYIALRAHTLERLLIVVEGLFHRRIH